MKKQIVNLENKKVKDLDINTNVFGIKPLPDIIHQYIRYQNAKSRQGTHKTKTRSEVNGRAKKPFAQKGTGNARQGSSKPPHYRGGATSMGPQNRDHSFSLNKKEKTLALKCALSNKSKKEEALSSWGGNDNKSSTNSRVDLPNNDYFKYTDLPIIVRIVITIVVFGIGFLIMSVIYPSIEQWKENFFRENLWGIIGFVFFLPWIAAGIYLIRVLFK